MRHFILTIGLLMFGLPAFAQMPEDDSVLVDEFIISQEFVDAEITRIRPSSRTITVRGKNHGKTRQFRVPEDARITVRGREARLRDLRVGDSVLITMRPNVDEIIISRVQAPNASESLETRQANPIESEAMPSQLPKTASYWPNVLGAGLVALFGAGLVRSRRIKSSK